MTMEFVVGELSPVHSDPSALFINSEVCPWSIDLEIRESDIRDLNIEYSKFFRDKGIDFFNNSRKNIEEFLSENI